jgi:hypothetical protein
LQEAPTHFHQVLLFAWLKRPDVSQKQFKGVYDRIDARQADRVISAIEWPLILSSQPADLRPIFGLSDAL